jgi:hypothetical protein
MDNADQQVPEEATLAGRREWIGLAVLALLGGCRGKDADRAARGVADDGLPARPAAENRVESELQPGQTAVVRPGVTEHLRAHVPLRVDALLLVQDGEPGALGGGDEHAAAQAALIRRTAVATRKDERIVDGIARDNFEDRIVIYQDTLERDFGHDPELLRAQVERTLRHEVAHHLGWHERGVRDLGL